MTVVHTYFYIVVDTQRGCRTLKKDNVCYQHDSCSVGLIKLMTVNKGNLRQRDRIKRFPFKQK